MQLLRKQLGCAVAAAQLGARLFQAGDALTPLSALPVPRSTASNSNRSTPACSPILRKRSRSPTPQDAPGDAMVEKGSDHSSDKSPSTPEQGVQRNCSSQSGRSGAKNSKVRASAGPWGRVGRAAPVSSAAFFSGWFPSLSPVGCLTQSPSPGSGSALRPQLSLGPVLSRSFLSRSCSLGGSGGKLHQGFSAHLENQLLQVPFISWIVKLIRFPL